MLRVSAQTTATNIDIQGIRGSTAAADQGIEHGALLIAFAEAVAKRDQPEIDAARKALEKAAGTAVMVDAAGVAANFQRMVRIADSVGIPVDDMDNEFGQQTRAALDLDQYHSARNSLEL